MSIPAHVVFIAMVVQWLMFPSIYMTCSKEKKKLARWLVVSPLSMSMWLILSRPDYYMMDLQISDIYTLDADGVSKQCYKYDNTLIDLSAKTHITEPSNYQVSIGVPLPVTIHGIYWESDTAGPIVRITKKDTSTSK